MVNLILVKELKHLEQIDLKSFMLTYSFNNSRIIRLLYQTNLKKLLDICYKTIGDVFKKQDININTVDFINRIIIIDVWNNEEGSNDK